MKKQHNTRAIVESGICAALTFIFAVISIFVPLASFFASFLAPVPAAVAGYRYGAKYSLLTIIAAALMVAIIISPLSSASLLLFYGPPAVVAGYGMRRYSLQYKTLLIGTLATVMGCIAMFSMVQIITGVPLIETVSELFEASNEATKGIYQKMIDSGALTEAQMQEYNIYYDEFIVTMKKMVPALIFIVSAITVYVTIMLTGLILKRMNENVSTFPPFKYFTLPRTAVIGGLLMYLMAFAAGRLELLDTSVILTNVQSILAFIFVIQGAAAAVYWLSSREMGRGIYFFILVILLITTFGRTLLFYLGIFDISFNARKLFAKGN